MSVDVQQNWGTYRCISACDFTGHWKHHTTHKCRVQRTQFISLTFYNLYYIYLYMYLYFWKQRGLALNNTVNKYQALPGVLIYRRGNFWKKTLKKEQYVPSQCCSATYTLYSIAVWGGEGGDMPLKPQWNPDGLDNTHTLTYTQTNTHTPWDETQ